MNYRKLGNTGLEVSEISFGCWGIGGLTPGSTSYGETNDEVSIAALNCAFDNGINFFDTSNVYGYGHSEELLGKTFINNRSQVILATKVGFVDYDSPPNFSIDSILFSLNASLNRLKTNYVDVLQLHNITHSELKNSPFLINLLRNLKEDGTVRALGVSVKSPYDALEIFDIFQFDVIQSNFNMLDIRVLSSGLYDLINKYNVGLIARTPLAFGFLAGNFSENHVFPKDDHRSNWSQEQINLWIKGSRHLLNLCKESINSPHHELAIRFCLSYASVSTCLVGILNPQEVLKNLKASIEGPLSLNSCNLIESDHSLHNYFL
jgi:aryl-alcohol dehydrogenase-like predicted oxidoreductase